MEMSSKHARTSAGIRSRGPSAARRLGRFSWLAPVAVVLSAMFAAPALAESTPPVVEKQPASVTVEEGHAARFESVATGSPTPTVQWESSTNGGETWKNVSKATSTVLTITAPKNADSGNRYRAHFKNASGEATSQAATLTVSEPPVVTKQPTSKVATEGSNVTFEASASGFPAPSVQWEVSADGGQSWQPAPYGNSPSLLLVNVTGAQSGNEYRARFTDPAGSATSSVATLTVESVATVTLQPKDALVLVGETATFEAAAERGYPKPTVQWEVSSDSGAHWTAIEGATNKLLSVPSTTLAENGNRYRAAFTNVAGTAYSAAARLVVSATDYGAFGWGLNTHGQAGVGSIEPTIPAPLPIEGLGFVTSVAGGMRHSLALLANGTVESWGFDSHGQLGDEGVVATRTPILVENLTGVTQVAAGGNHSLALLSNGTVMAWGDDESGQLGNGKTLDSEVPIAVPGLSGVVAIAAGEEDSLALLANGTVMAWGNNERGQLGTGNRSNKTSPAEVKGLAPVKQIAAGGQFNLALNTDGTVVAWGDDEHGQLGNRVFFESANEEDLFSTAPLPVEGLSGVSAIAAGRTHALALLSGGTLAAWGNDAEGELGNGAIEPLAQTPVPVSAIGGVTAITAGDQESAALLGSGAIEAWGSNTSGTLGIGADGSPSDVPVEVHSIGGAAGISAGGSQMLAFGATLPTVTSLSPSSGPVSGGTTVTITGADIGAASAVHFGSSAAASWQVDSSSSITAVSPAGTGTVNVTVTTSSGTSPAAPGNRFSYRVAPTVLKLSAKSGPASGGTTVTITGTEFSGASEVVFGTVATKAFTVNSNTSITVTSPANSGGTMDVKVIATGGASAASSKDHFKYTPEVEGLSPSSGPTAGGTAVTISGYGFVPGTSGTSFKFGKGKAQSVECASTTSCTAIAPAARAPGTVDVTVLSAKAKGTVNAGDRFTYE